MNAFHPHFRVVGEVAEMVLLDGPSKRLLVDVSSDPLGEHMSARRTNLVTLTLTDEELIGRFLRDVSVGDVTAASGTFHQSNYIPYKTTYIDTVFLIAEFEKLDRNELVEEYKPRSADRPASPTLH